MIQLAQDVIKAFGCRFRSTINMVAGVAETVGVPIVPAILKGIAGQDEQECGYEPVPWTAAPPPPPPPPAAPAKPVVAEPIPVPPADPVPEKKEAKPAPKKAKAAPKKRTGKRRQLKGKNDATGKVKPLKVEDAINNSTYLARIIWCLGVAKMEEMGPLRPADIARMIMARSPVSLEPPNVARYIRRSKPKYISVAQKEGSSSFYALNDDGWDLFQEKFKK